MTPPKPLLAAPFLGALVLSVCTLAACERSDPAQDAINTAIDKLEAQSVGGGSALFSDNSRKKTLGEVVSALTSVVSEKDPGKSSAAAVLLSRAKEGLGEIAAKEASETELKFVAETSVTRALVDQWNSQHASAAAASKYDPSKDLAEIDKSIAELNAAAKKREADKAAQERVVAEIQSRAETAHASARKERDREADIRKSGEGQSQTAREQIIRQAVEASRAADALDKQAADLAAEAAKEQPKVAEIASDIDRIHAHIEYLRNSKANIEQRADAARQQSASAQHDADAVGKPITDSLAELAMLRDTASGPASDAQKKFEEAIAAAKKSSTAENKAGANAAQGAAQQSLGDLLSVKVRSLTVYLATLEAVAKSVPPAPAAGDAGKKADEVRKELEDARERAKNAYKDAIASYDKAGASQKIKDVKEALKKLTEEAPPPPPPAPKPEAGAPSEHPADSKPAASALSPEEQKAVETAARDLLKKLSDAVVAANLSAFRDLVVLRDDSQKSAFDGLVGSALNFQKFDAACHAKYGKTFKELAAESKVAGAAGNPMIAGAGKLTTLLAPDNVAKATVTVLGPDKADAQIPGDDSATHIVKDGDAWKVDLSQELGMVAAMGPMLKMLTTVSEAFAQFAADIPGDKYPTADAMLTALNAKLMGAMGGMLPGGGGPPPGGGG
jgi:hypothetical protein